MAVGGAGDEKTSPNHYPNPSNMDLEHGMMKAYEDTELLKSIVLPLEEQIEALKDKLRQTDHHLIESEKRQTKMVLGVEALTKWLDGKTFDEAVQHLENRQKELLSFSELKQKEVEDCEIVNCDAINTLNGESSGKAGEPKSTEIYISLLLSRIALLQKELGSTKCELSNHVLIIDKIRKSNAELRNQVYNSNSQIVRIQKDHLSELSNITSVMTEEQKCKLSLIVPTTSTNEENQNTKQNVIETKSEEQMYNVNKDEVMTVRKSDWLGMDVELNKVRALLGGGAGDNVVGGERFRQLQLR